jgi:predicted CXXCH cytochrome family protein
MNCSFNRERRAVAIACRAWLLLLTVCAVASGQISPGELSNAHSSLNGAGHCTDCHDAGKKPPEFKCLSCHRDIRERIESSRGFHPSLVGSDKTGRSCARCHIEHNGRDFNIVHWDIPVQKFDHEKTGYRLEGRHESVACKTCHQPSHIPVAHMEGISVKDKTRTFLGLSRKCMDCHADVHQGELSAECGRCHDEKDWKRPTRFDHRVARFSLDAAHEKVPCAKCHTPPGSAKVPPMFKNLSFGDCTPCHRDPHSGAFRNPCRTCHTSQKTEWAGVNASAGFDHSRTRFPLLGRHAGVTCYRCHSRGDFAKPVAFAKCADCHKSDPHRGQFSSAVMRDCDYCHSVSGFKPSTFKYAQHNTTSFPLRERHIETPCAKCHLADASGTVIYRFRDFSCAACHQDIHGSQFAGSPYENHCDACHGERDFKLSTFTATRHSDTRFPLSGGHRKATCAECHKPTPKPAKFRFEDRDCMVCHSDPHGSESSIRTCETCHTVNTWQELEIFDHSTTAYPLQGAHQKVSCSKCHEPAKSTGSQTILFNTAPKQCAGCHEDPHAGQFASRMSVLFSDGRPAGCRICHSVASWHELAGFDHSATAFPLQGAHQKVSCSKCHRSDAQEGRVKPIDYLKAPKQCSSCHEDVHAGQFVSNSNLTDCTRCHQTQQWSPSEFDHNTQSSYKLTGTHRNVRCSLCHSNTKEIAGKKIFIYKGTARDCSACHQSGRTENQP